MQFIKFAVIGILCMTPVFALADDTASTGVGFGNAYCEGSVPCSTDSSAMSSIVANASGCVGRHFGFGGATFDPNGSLDSNGCIPNLPNSQNGQQTGLTMSAHCCVTQTADTCHVQCQLVGSHQ